MRRYCIIALLCLSTVFECQAQDEVYDYWQKTVVSHCFGKEYINFRVDQSVSTRYKGELSDDVVVRDPIYIARGPNYICSDNSFDCVMMTTDSLFVDFYLDGNFYYGSISNITTEFERNIAEALSHRMQRGMHEITPFYLLPHSKEFFNLPFVSFSDCGNGSHLLKYIYPATFVGAEGLTDTVSLWVDDSTGLVYRALAFNHYDSISGLVTDCRISDISFDPVDVSHYRRAVPQDADYASYNFNRGEHCPSESDIYVKDEDMGCLINTPLVSTTHDTVRIADLKGWVLLDVWRYGCRPCAKFDLQMAREQDSLGYRVLEHEGITVLCANPHARVNDRFVEFAQQFRISDVAYSAVGLSDCVNFGAYPHYILFSPDKKVAFRGSSLGEGYGDYRYIHKAKEAYNKKHKK